MRFLIKVLVITLTGWLWGATPAFCLPAIPDASDPNTSLVLAGFSTDSFWQVAQDRSVTTPQGPQPGVAISLALFPGVAVHGMGHFYAGRPMTGSMLLLVEAGSVYMAYRGGSDVVASTQNYTLNGFDGQNAQTSLGLGLAVSGVILFLTSWLYDLTGAPIAAAESASTPKVSTQISPRGIELVLEKKF